MMKGNDVFHYLSDVLPFRRRRSADWVLPASVGLGVGVAFGVGVGLLIAPHSGELTRRRLRDGAQRVKERAMSAARKAAEEHTEGGRTLAGESSLVAELGEIR